MREFGTGYIILERNHIKSIIKDGVAQKLLLKNKGTLQSPGLGYTNIILVAELVFL